MTAPPALSARTGIRPRLSIEQRLAALALRPTRLATGIPALDTGWRGGLPSGSLWTIAGPPSAGKTSFVAHLAHQWIDMGVPVWWVAGDEGPDRVLVRLGQHLGLDRTALENGATHERTTLNEALKGKPLEVFDDADIRSGVDPIDLARSLRETHPKEAGPAVIVLDSLQRLATTFPLDDGEADTERGRIHALLSLLASAGVEHELVIILLSEMPRAAYATAGRGGHREEIASGKGDGSIEYFSDVFMSVRVSRENPYVARFFVSKSRPGPVSPFLLRQLPETCSYELTSDEPRVSRFLIELEAGGVIESPQTRVYLVEVMEAVNASPGISSNQIVRALKRSRKHTLAAIAHLEARGFLVNLGTPIRGEWQVKKTLPASMPRVSPGPSIKDPSDH